LHLVGEPKPHRDGDLRVAAREAVAVADARIDGKRERGPRIVKQILDEAVENAGDDDQHGKPREHLLVPQPIAERQKQQKERRVAEPGQAVKKKGKLGRAKGHHPRNLVREAFMGTAYSINSSVYCATRTKN